MTVDVAMTPDPNPTWKRLDAGRKAKAAKGGYAGYGSPAFGQRTENGELVADEKEQQIIELIRRHHKSGKSLQQVANWLNSNGYKTKRGQQWQRISVKRVLDRLYGKNPKIADTTAADGSAEDSSEGSSQTAAQAEDSEGVTDV